MDESLAKIRHERSKKDFPGLRLEEDEYVEYFFRRARVCLMGIWGGAFFGVVMILLGFLFVLMGQSKLDELGLQFMFIMLFSLLAAIFFIFLFALKVYYGNKLFITNRKVIQFIMLSPISSSINIIDLFSIEDASFRQDTLMQRIFHFGTLRLATVGDETTYTFAYSDIKPEELKAVTDLISEAKKLNKNNS